MLEHSDYSRLSPETRSMLLMKYNSNLYTAVYEEVEEKNYIKAEKELISFQQKQLEAFRRAKRRKSKQFYW